MLILLLTSDTDVFIYILLSSALLAFSIVLYIVGLMIKRQDIELTKGTLIDFLILRILLWTRKMIGENKDDTNLKRILIENAVNLFF